MNSEQAFDDNLTQYLRPRGVRRETLLEQLDPSFGEALLVVASGSILQGFGNATSDIDVLCLVDRPGVSAFPSSSFVGDVLFDVSYVDCRWAEAFGSILLDKGTEGQPGRPAERERFYDDLTRLSRFSLGQPLRGRTDWLAWRQRLRGPEFAAHISHWWATESLGLWAAARLLLEPNPLLAAQRYCDAGLALLNRRAAEQGELYVQPKWISAKLDRLGDVEGRALFDALMRVPVEADEVDPYVETVEVALHRQATDVDELTVEFRYADGVQELRGVGSTVVSRWLLRGVEFDTDPPPPVVGPDGVMWRGRLADTPESIRHLAGEDLLVIEVRPAR